MYCIIAIGVCAVNVINMLRLQVSLIVSRRLCYRAETMITPQGGAVPIAIQ